MKMEEENGAWKVELGLDLRKAISWLKRDYSVLLLQLGKKNLIQFNEKENVILRFAQLRDHNFY